MKIGILAISGKPYHIGHHCVVELAAQSNDQVVLFVSTSDRARKGETTILGEDMERIWKDYLTDIMPANVNIVYGNSPIRQVYSTLGEASERKLQNIYTVYGDPNDLAKNFPDGSLDKYANYLHGNGLVRLSSIPRTQTVQISGKNMREFLARGEKDTFLKYLPRGVDGEAIWEILHNRVVKRWM